MGRSVRNRVAKAERTVIGDQGDVIAGDKLGWQGPWGTTYAANLRLYMASLSESGWVQTARSLKSRPPMPCSC